MPVKVWNVGIVGFGMIAEIYVEALGAIPHARLVCICSRSADRARAAASRLGCDWTDDYFGMMRRMDIDIVCVTTSSGSHYSIAKAALQHDKHVVVEKPLAMTSRQADELIQLADRHRRVLSVISQTRFFEQHQLVKTVLEQGRLGKLLFVEISRPFYRTQAYYDSAEWRGTISEDGGAVMNQGIHAIDLLLWMAGPVEQVIARTATQTHRMEAEDIGAALLVFRNGALGSFMCSTSMSPGFEQVFNLYGERGAIRMIGNDVIHWIVPDTPLPERFDRQNQDERYGAGAADPRNISSRYHQLQLLDVLEAIEQGRLPCVTGEDGREAVRLVEMICESTRTGTNDSGGTPQRSRL